MDELDAYRAAKMLLDTEGENGAAAYVREQIADMTTRGDIAGKAAWLRIAAAIVVLRTTEAPAGQRVQ